MKSGNLNFLEPSGPPQACNGTALLLPLRNYLRIFNRTHFSIFIVAWMFFAETTNHCLTSERIKQSRLTNSACLVRHQRTHRGHEADSTTAGSLTFMHLASYIYRTDRPLTPQQYSFYIFIQQINLIIFLDFLSPLSVYSSTKCRVFPNVILFGFIKYSHFT